MNTQELPVRLDIGRRDGEVRARLTFENRTGVDITVPAYVFGAVGTAFFQICPEGGTTLCDPKNVLKYIGPYAKHDSSIVRTLAPSEKVETSVRIDPLYAFGKAEGPFRARYTWTCTGTVGTTERELEINSNQVVFQM
jgi:hypothetical protein